MRRILFALVVLACGPKDVIPSTPNHPANPGAPGGSDPVASTTPDAAPVDDKAAIAAAEKAAYEKARPVFEKYCAKCHSSKGAKSSQQKLDHFVMDTYPFGGHHATTIGETIRKVLGATGEAPEMPQDAPGSVKGAELEAIVEWSKAFDRAHAAGLHDHVDHGHHGDNP